MPDAVSAEFSRLTLIGGASAVATLHASDSLFDGVLACSGDVYLNHCYVRDLQHPPVAEGDAAAAPSAIVSRCATCGKARSVRLMQCMVWQLALTSDDLCSCKDASKTEPRDCATCTDLVCAQTCPLRASGQLWVPIKRPPNFDEPNRYPLPNFARLSSDNSKKISPEPAIATCSGPTISPCRARALPNSKRRCDRPCCRACSSIGSSRPEVAGEWSYQSSFSL